MQNLTHFAIKINRWNWHFGVLVFKIFPGENTPGPGYIGRTFSARMFCPPTLNSFQSLCITNFIVQIIILSGPSKPGNTDSVSLLPPEDSSWMKQAVDIQPFSEGSTSTY